MSAEEFFREVVQTYKQKKQKSGVLAPDLRAYCEERHVSWRAFKSWSLNDETASLLIAEEQSKKHCRKARSRKKTPSSSHRRKAEPSGNPVLHRLQIKSPSDEIEVDRGEASLLLRGVGITFPCGVRVTVREATGKAILMLIGGEATDKSPLCLH